MTEEQFIHRVIDEYQKARRPVRSDKRLTRGTSRSISGITEDLFAKYLASKFPDDQMHIYIDQNFTVDNENGFFGKKNKGSFRPDIALVKNSIVMAVFDLKQDLGWKRTQTEVEKSKYEEAIKFYRTRKAVLTNKKNSDKNKDVWFSKNLVRQFVIVSDLNISKETLQRNKALFKTVKMNKFFFLTSEVHPNSYDYGPKGRKKKVKLNIGAFDEILKLTERQIASASK